MGNIMQPGQLKIFVKSGNAVRLLSCSLGGNWTVERISGASTGKQMCCNEVALDSINGVINDQFGGLTGESTEVEIKDHYLNVLELVKTLGWPVWVNDDACGQTGSRYRYAVKVCDSGYWLGRFETQDKAETFITKEGLVLSQSEG